MTAASKTPSAPAMRAQVSASLVHESHRGLLRLEVEIHSATGAGPVASRDLPQGRSASVPANAGSATSSSTSCRNSIGPCTCASIWVSSTRPVSSSAGSRLGCASSPRTSSRRATVRLGTPSVGARNGGHGGAAMAPLSISANRAAMTLSIQLIMPSCSVARGSSLPANVKEVRLVTLGWSTR